MVGIDGDGGDQTWGGDHTVQCTGSVLWNCAPETCIVLLTSVHSNKSNKKGKINKRINKTLSCILIMSVGC